MLSFLYIIKFYSQTCLYDYLYKTTTRLRRPMMSPPRPVPIECLYKTTTCLTRPATTFFVPQMKKNLFKTTTAKFSLRLYFLYCYLVMQSLPNAWKNWTFITFKIGLLNYPSSQNAGFPIYSPGFNLLGGFKFTVISAFLPVDVD